MEGTKLGKYDLRAELGRGVMGTVYAAWDPVIERKIAIKTVNLPAGDADEARAMLGRFKREAQAAGRLHHPNIVDVFDYGEGDGGFSYIVMEFVEGRSLKSMLDSGERLPLRDVLRVMEDLLAGLQSSHQRGVIHRDIKPGNIMLTPDGRTKIADFGLAKIENSGMTQSGTILGTPAYMPPEQFMGQLVDPRSDIYAAGVVLYQLLTGERPFDGSPTSIMHKVLNTRPPKPSELSVVAPPALDAVVARAISLRPEDRYPDAAAFAMAIRQAIEAGSRSPTAVPGDPLDREATVVVPRRGSTGAVTPSSRSTRHVTLPTLAVGTLIAALLVSIGAWLISGQHEPTTEMSRVARGPVSALLQSVQPAPTPTPQSTPSSEEQTAPPGLPPGAPVSSQSSPEAAPQLDLQVGTMQASPSPQPSAPTVQEEGPTTERSPPVVSSPAVEERVATPGKVAPVAPPLAELRRAVRDAVAMTPCTLVSGDIVDEGNALALKAVAVTSSEARLRMAVAKAAPMLSLDWTIEVISEPYCSALELIRPLVAKFGMPSSGLTVSIGDGRTHLLEGDSIVLHIVAPNYRSRVRLDDVQSDGTVYHMQPSDGYPESLYEPLSQHSWGDPRSGVIGPAVVQAPFGIDLIIAIASERPLFLGRRPTAEPTEVYLRALRSAIEAAQAQREVITATVLALVTSERP